MHEQTICVRDKQSVSASYRRLLVRLTISIMHPENIIEKLLHCFQTTLLLVAFQNSAPDQTSKALFHMPLLDNYGYGRQKCKPLGQNRVVAVTLASGSLEASTSDVYKPRQIFNAHTEPTASGL